MSTGRWCLVVGSVLIWAAILVLSSTYGYEQTWQVWRVPTMVPAFADFRLLPGTLESLRRGLDPTVDNPGDPYHRLFNYPAVWLLLRYTGLTDAHTVWICVAMIALVFVAAWLFPGSITPAGAVLMLLVLFSPAAMLLYERGNVDSAIVILLAVTVLALNGPPLVAPLLILAAGVLKFFPVVAVVALAARGRAAFLRGGAMIGAVMAVYMAATAKAVVASWAGTQRGEDISYGAQVLAMKYHLLPPALSAGPYAVAAILLAGAAWLGGRCALASTNARNLDAFRIGAAVYVGTFLLGNNWDYRLVFLVLVLPQLAAWLHDAPAAVRVVVGATVVAVLLSCWYLVLGYTPGCPVPRPCTSGETGLFLLDEVLNWWLLAALMYLLVASRPTWVAPRRAPARPAA